MSANSGNPLNVIQNRMQILRAEREQTESEMDALEKEKEAIKHILPRVIAELELKRDTLEHKNKEAVLETLPGPPPPPDRLARQHPLQQ